jgi:hypothetical protein
MHVDISIILFGSRLTGNARPDSDYDVFLVSEEFAKKVVPQPLPHHLPQFYDPSFGIANHHQAKRAWSLDLWNRLGGNAGIDRFRELAAKNLRDRFPEVTAERVDLFLHLPKSVSRTVYTVRLVWEDVHARFDFAYDALRQYAGASPELEQFANQVLEKYPTRRQQAIELEKRLTELGGASVTDAHLQYKSLPEQLRRNPVYQQHAPLIEPS